jgi:hypothetical protein
LAHSGCKKKAFLFQNAQVCPCTRFIWSVFDPPLLKIRDVRVVADYWDARVCSAKRLSWHECVYLADLISIDNRHVFGTCTIERAR